MNRAAALFIGLAVFLGAAVDALAARRAQGRGAAARRLGRRTDRARQARRHLQEAWARRRNSLHPGRAGIDPGADRRLDRHRGRGRRFGRRRHLRQGRADPHHRQRDHRRARSVLVRPRRIPGPQDRGLQRQDGRLFADRLVQPRRPARADRAVQADGQADVDRQHHRDAHPDVDRPGRCRLFGDPVLSRQGGRRANPHHRDRQRCGLR